MLTLLFISAPRNVEGELEVDAFSVGNIYVVEVLVLKCDGPLSGTAYQLISFDGRALTDIILRLGWLSAHVNTSAQL